MIGAPVISAAATGEAAATKPTVQQNLIGKRLGKAYGAADDPAPERLILTLTAKPATSQAVSWRARLTTNPLQAAIVPASSGPLDEKGATSVLAKVERLAYADGLLMAHASVEFTGLRPSTRYAYRVGDGKSWSEWNQFRTADEESAPFQFIYLGDLQNGILSQGARLLREAVLKAGDARFMVHAGDLVTNPFDDQLWYEWYAAAGWIYRMIPSLLTPGNHDLGSGGADKIWRPQFALPRNGPLGQEELTYYLDYQGVRLISLNGNAYRDKAQLAWLETVLRVKNSAWTIVVTHQPLYSTGKGRDDSKRRKTLMPFFDKYGVDLVLQGHDHTYGRTPKIRAGRIVKADEAGVVYATSVSGTKMYKLNAASQPFMARLGANKQLYQVISIADDRLGYEAYTVNGELFDSFELRRGGTNRTTLRNLHGG